MHARQLQYSIPESSGSICAAHAIHHPASQTATLQGRFPFAPEEDPTSEEPYAPRAKHDQAQRGRDLTAASVGNLAAHDVSASQPDAMLPPAAAAGGRVHSAPASIASPDLLWRDLMQRPMPSMAEEPPAAVAGGPRQPLHASGAMGVQAAHAPADEPGMGMRDAGRLPHISTHEEHARWHLEALATEDQGLLQRFPTASGVPQPGGQPLRAALADQYGQPMHPDHAGPSPGGGARAWAATHSSLEQAHVGPYPHVRSGHAPLQLSRHDQAWGGDSAWAPGTFDTMGNLHGQHALAADGPFPEMIRGTAGGLGGAPAAATAGGRPPAHMPYNVPTGGPGAYDSRLSDRYMASSAADYRQRPVACGMRTSPGRSLQDLTRTGSSGGDAAAHAGHGEFYTSPRFDSVAADAVASVVGGAPRAFRRGAGGQPAAGAPWSTDRSHGFAAGEAQFLNPQVSTGSRDTDGPESQSIHSAERSMHGSEAVAGAAGQQRSVDRLIQLDHLNRCGV